MQHKTKIVATLGPATDNEAILRDLLAAGVDVARYNFSHGTHEEQLARVNLTKKIRAELDLPIALMADTKGPEIRLGMIPDGPVRLETDSTLTLTTDTVDGTAELMTVSYPELPRDVTVGDRILLDDGLIALRVDKTDAKTITTTVLNGGQISSRKGVNVPNVQLRMPFISDRDIEDLTFAVANDFDYVAASFSRNAADIEQLRGVLKTLGGEKLKIIAKIENAEGIAQADAILEAADGIMIARGDMGVEVALEELPIIQKILIRKGLHFGKPVITATQMLDSMTQNPRPTRAEVTDVANAIYDNTSAIMLSGETAKGLYPVEAVRTMVRIAEYAESGFVPVKSARVGGFDDRNAMITHAVSHSTCTTAADLSAAAIITVTRSGETAAQISRHRPDCTIVGCSPDQKVYRQMSLFWGVRPVLTEIVDNGDELMENALDAAVRAGHVSKGDLVVFTAGLPLTAKGGPATNMQRVHVVGDAV